MAQRRAATSRLMVIDASVLRAAGGEHSVHPVSAYCRDFLTQVYEICHRCVVNFQIEQEWRDHASRYGRSWQTQMASRRKIIRAPDFDGSALKAALAKCGLTEAGVVAAQKDFHLVEAALASDLLVVSLDDEARGNFASAASEVRQFGSICWMNPSQPGEPMGQWLMGEIETPRSWNLDPARERR